MKYTKWCHNDFNVQGYYLGGLLCHRTAIGTDDQPWCERLAEHHTPRCFVLPAVLAQRRQDALPCELAQAESVIIAHLH